MKPLIASLVSALLLSGCVAATATVSDYNGASVKVQTSTMVPSKEAMAAAQKEANRICSIGSMKRAEYASTRPLPDNLAEHLFLCL